MSRTCIEHPHEQAEGLCRRCGASHCADCLVYPFGPAQPPYCVPCAVEAAGLRSGAGKRLQVVPKENKRRLKEWRKARKRDLEAPPPDGVATWQRMDESETEAEEEAASAAQTAAEREALRLPPPVMETPTPPPGVNLAPPGPGDEDWRNEITAGGKDEPLLGFLDDDEPPTPLIVPAADPYQPPAYQPTTQAYEPPAYRPTTPVEPTTYDPTAFEPDPTFDRADNDPIPLHEPTVFEPPSYTPTDAGPAAPYESTFQPTPFEPAGIDPVPAFEPTSFGPPPFEPTPAVDTPAAAVFEPSGDPLASFGTPPPPAFDPADAPPLPPATSLADFGLGDLNTEPTPMAFADDPPPPPAFEPSPVAAAPPAVAAPRPTAPELANAPIRPATPTRIPAAKPGDAKGDAKDMLARIAALRSDKE